MTLNVLTLALDAAPWLPCLFVELNRLDGDWHWVVVEGVAQPVKDTAWMRGQPSRLSRDGTHEFLQDLKHHPRITVLSQPEWPGKTAMCQAGTDAFSCPGVLLQADSDELWTVRQMQIVRDAFAAWPALSGMRFWMRYFVGPNVVTEGDNSFGNRRTPFEEWTRAWRFSPGMKWDSHEPPVLNGNRGEFMSRDETLRLLGDPIDHYAYATTKQARAKETLYGYDGAVEAWLKIQSEPQLIARHFPWAGANAQARHLFPPL